MRTSTFLLALGLFGSAFSAPVAEPNVNPILFTKDPLAIHKRSEVDIDIPEKVEDIIMTPAFQAEVEASSSTASSQTPSDDSCSAICGVQRVEGAKSEREALCSSEGLLATLQCAQCIDQTWPDTSYEDSAMAEYERIVSACDDSPQQ
ncbi:uncharacterized protein I303_100510 [Kwoniella dejecticola CBS 10117]|uniref:Uncharacterized protein n=1 Tax=Kwoniella dejecticola CBS 10117 TaxID=1296121 RepID=A0A1A6AF89_9TREE|nr:uncharacterized protein I303_00510 [Kwoniella dejecticola CBS 10117]OBR88693.1 hypothetical protein I303_00510 [Kwoniella dejecticola CBS 10117]